MSGDVGHPLESLCDKRVSAEGHLDVTSSPRGSSRGKDRFEVGEDNGDSLRKSGRTF